MSLTDSISVNPPSREKRRRPVTVMVIDDERDPRESMCEWLTTRGYDVIPARDGADALERLRSDEPRPNVILLDLTMPIVNGWQFREQQMRDPGLASIPVIVITANRDTRGIQADDTLFKPVKPEVLLKVVQRWSPPEPALSFATPIASGASAATPLREPSRTAPRGAPPLRPVPPFSERLVDMLGHDLRNPLTAIAMTAGLLASQATTAEVVEPVQRILGIVERMDLMIAHLTEFLRARLGRELVLRREGADLSDVCEKIVRALSASTRREIELTVKGPLAGMWDRARTELLLATLVTHACDRDQTNAPVRLRADGSSPGFVQIEVAHQGLPSVDFGGESADVEAECIRLGLGMFVARRIVHAYAGEIEVQTDGAAASRFVVVLPREAQL